MMGALMTGALRNACLIALLQESHLKYWSITLTSAVRFLRCTRISLQLIEKKKDAPQAVLPREPQQGLGYQVGSDGTRYEGQFKGGRPHGYGRIFWPTGVRYEGEFVDGLIQGIGVGFGVRNTYRGEWRNNKPNGKGILETPDGIKYEGHVKDGLPHGIGREAIENQEYEVTYIKGQKIASRAVK